MSLRPPLTAIVLAAFLMAAGRGLASEVSERLSARAEIAYDAGRYEEAQDLFAQASAADPQDATAHYGLGLALLALERWDTAARSLEDALALRPGMEDAQRALALARDRGGEAEATTVRPLKRWEVHAATGVQYDSNVTISPGGDVLPGLSPQNDVAFIFAAGGRHDVLVRSNMLVRLEYDLYQTLHVDLDDYDFRSHRIRGTASYALHPALWAGVQGGYNHYTLGDHSYLGEPVVLPFLSFLEEEWGISQVSYRHGGDTYFSRPYNDVRDGPNNSAGIDQTFFLADGISLSLGYLYGTENPDSSTGEIYDFRAHQGYLNVVVPLWWATTIDLTYLYRREDYAKDNPYDRFGQSRLDNAHHVAVDLRRPLAKHLNAVVSYFGTINNSSIDVYSYDRNVVSALLEVSY